MAVKILWRGTVLVNDRFNILPGKIPAGSDFETCDLILLQPFVQGGLGDLEDGAYFGSFEKRFFW